MKTQVQRKAQGFTLIEMVGVLAIIAILAAMLVPRIMSAINDSRVANAVGSINTAKTAALGYFGKYGRFAGTNGVAVTAPVVDWDAAVLVPEGFMDTPLATSVAQTSQVRLVTALTAADAADVSNAAFNLDDNTGNGANDAPGQYVIVAYLGNVPIEDAVSINNRIDGQLDPVIRGSTAENTVGRVKYAAAANGVTDVYVYLAHK